MKLNQLKRNEVRSIVFEEAGMIIKRHDSATIQELLKSYDESKMVKIYNPTEEQKQAMRELLSVEDDQLKASGQTMLLMVAMLTDIEGIDDLSEEESVAILSDPSPLLETVCQEINAILTSVIKEFYEKLAILNTLPEPVLKKAIEESAKQKGKVEEENKKAQKEAEIARLKAEFENKLKELED